MVLTRRQRRALSARLENLAPELLRHIFGCFCLHCHGGPGIPYWSQHEPTSLETTTSSSDLSSYWDGRQALYSLSLVSKRFCHVAQSVLFHEFLIPIGQHPSLHQRIEPFLRTISSRQDLAQMVRTVSLDEYLLCHLDIEYARVVCEDALHALGTSLSQCGKRRRQGRTQRSALLPASFEISQRFLSGRIWRRELANDYVRRVVGTEVLVILTALLPNLHHLILHGHGFPRETFPLAASALDLTRIPLKILDAVSVIPSILAIAPDLETMHLEPEDSYPEIPGVKEVYFRGFGTNDNVHAEQIFSSCSDSLSVFSYETTYIESSVNQSTTRVLQPGTAVRLLSKFYSSLRCLHLDMRFRVAYDRDSEVEPMPSLKEFITLEVLFLTTNSVYNGRSSRVTDEQSLVHLLPHSIRSLTFVDPEFPPPPGRLYQGLLTLANAKRHDDMFPNLKQLRCDSKEIYEDRVIKDLFSQVGVDFEHQEFPTRNWSYSREPLPPQSPRRAVEAYQQEFPDGGGFGGPLPGPLSDDDL